MFEAIAGFLSGASKAIDTVVDAGKSKLDSIAGENIFDKAGTVIGQKIDMVKDPEKFADYLTDPERAKNTVPKAHASIVPIEGYRNAEDAGSLLSQLASMNNQ